MKWYVLPLMLLLVYAKGHEAHAIDSPGFWKSFRKSSPFPIQDIVVSPVGSSGDVTIVLSEPPPGVWNDREAAVRRAFPDPDKLVSMVVKTHRIGFDGWVKDIVVTLRSADEGFVDNGVRRLNNEYFGTAYGASYSQAKFRAWDAVASPRRHEGPPNLKISAASLDDWLFVEKASIFDQTGIELTDGDTARIPVENLESVFNSATVGVFHSRPSGLVLLSVRRDKPLNDSRALIRQFTLDSDTLIGAVTMDASPLLVLVGRTRTTSLSDMPPLRVETILTLAATSERDLAQSYERNAPLAGAVRDGELRKALDPAFDPNSDVVASPKYPLSAAADWAPILLSRELTNTEFGQLLNITDQMLKGWSQSNLVGYVNFPYPAPANFPYATGIFDHLTEEFHQEISSLTFNWNTSGYGSWSRFGDHEIFSVLNTNALPVSYFPDDSSSELSDEQKAVIRSVEDLYGDFYASLRDPSLARVAQYAALHVIFTKYSVMANRTEPMPRGSDYDQRWTTYKRIVSEAVTRLNSTQVAAVEGFGSTMSCEMSGFAPTNESRETIQAYLKYPTRLDRLLDALVDPHRFTRAINAKSARHDDAIEAYNGKVDAFKTAVSLCHILPSASECSALPRERDLIDAENHRLTVASDALREERDSSNAILADGQKVSRSLLAVGDCDAAWKSVRDAAIVQDESVFKTPSIVVSTDVRGTMTGGHNLYGRSVEVLPDAKVTVGSIEINATGNSIRVNPSDISRSRSIAREFERNRADFLNGNGTVRASIEKRVTAAMGADPGVVQAFTAETLGLTNSARTTALGGASGRRAVGSVVAQLPDDQLRSAVKLADATKADVVVGVRDGSYSLIDPGPPPYGLSTQSPFEMLRLIEGRAARAAVDASAEGDFVIVSDGSLSLAEMHGIKISANARQMVAEAGGGGGTAPPNNRVAFFMEREPDQTPPIGPRQPNGQRGAGEGGDGPPTNAQTAGPEKGSWDLLAVFPFRDNVRRVLARTDGNWRAAWEISKVSEKPVEIDVGARSMTRVIEIPFGKLDNVATREPSLFVTWKAYFKKRVPTAETDGRILDGVIRHQFENAPDGTSVLSKLISVRKEYDRKVNGDAILRGTLRTEDIDFMVVERAGNGTRRG